MERGSVGIGAGVAGVATAPSDVLASKSLTFDPATFYKTAKKNNLYMYVIIRCIKGDISNI